MYILAFLALLGLFCNFAQGGCLRRLGGIATSLRSRGESYGLFRLHKVDDLQSLRGGDDKSSNFSTLDDASENTKSNKEKLPVSNNYVSICDSAFCKVMADSMKEIQQLRKTIVDNGVCVQTLGSKADEICNSAIERFSAAAPLMDESKASEQLYDKRIDEIEQLLDMSLQTLYQHQLHLIKEKALKKFRSTTATTEGAEFEAMLQAEDLFRKEAEDSTRPSPGWSYAKELNSFRSCLNEACSRGKKIAEVRAQAHKQNTQAMQFLQMQQQQLQAIQQQIGGGGSPWNMAVAYRIPDTNFNLNFNYQQGRGTLQVSCVPDESVPLLGANGFVHGVTPGNIGVSFNVNF